MKLLVKEGSDEHESAVKAKLRGRFKNEIEARKIGHNSQSLLQVQSQIKT